MKQGSEMLGAESGAPIKTSVVLHLVAALLERPFYPALVCLMPQRPSKPFYSGDAGKKLHIVSLRTGLARILQTLMKWKNH